LPIRYVFEATQGLSSARNRALREFVGDVLLFTDDDVEVDPGWLAAFAAAARTNRDAQYFGGRVVPVYPHGRPAWLREESERLALIDGLLVRFHVGETTRPFVAQDPTPFGASFGVRRSLVDRNGMFRTDLGVSGGVPGRGEEADYLDRALRAGAKGIYVGDAIVYHSTDPARLRFRYLYQFGIQKGIAARRMGSTETGSVPLAMLFILRGLLQALKGRGDRLRQCVINAGIQVGLRRTGSGAA